MQHPSFSFYCTDTKHVEAADHHIPSCIPTVIQNATSINQNEMCSTEKDLIEKPQPVELYFPQMFSESAKGWSMNLPLKTEYAHGERQSACLQCGVKWSYIPGCKTLKAFACLGVFVVRTSAEDSDVSHRNALCGAHLWNTTKGSENAEWSQRDTGGFMDGQTHIFQKWNFIWKKTDYWIK